jgi:hypothetical protein
MWCSRPKEQGRDSKDRPLNDSNFGIVVFGWSEQMWAAKPSHAQSPSSASISSSDLSASAPEGAIHKLHAEQPNP